MAQANPDFDQILSTSLKLYRPKLVDNLSVNQALFYLLKENGLWEELEGSPSIVQPLLTGENGNIANYEQDDPFPIDPTEGIDAAEVNWKQKVITIRINGFQEFANQGKQRVISLFDAKVRQAELTMQLDEDEQLFGDGTADSGLTLTGLGLAVEDGTAWSEYAGIDSNVYSFWRNVWLGAVGSFATNGLKKMRTAYNSCSIMGKDHPTLGITTQDIFEAFEAAHTEQKIFTDTNLLQAGFENFKFKSMPLVFDENMDSGEMLMLNSNYIKYVVGKGRNFLTTEFRRLFENDARVAQIYVYRNIVMMRRRAHARLTGITTP